MEKETPRRQSYHPMGPHSVLVSSPGQRRRQPQAQGMNYGHCIQHRRNSENLEPQTVLEQRRQSYDPSVLHQMMYEQSQGMVHGPMYPGSLSQTDYYMGPPPPRSTTGGEYFSPISENPGEQSGWMGGMPQSSPRRHPSHSMVRKAGSQTDIGHFMDDPSSPSTPFGESNSQLGPLMFNQDQDELYDPSEFLSINPLIDDSITSQKMGYGPDMSQPVDHVTYMKKKSSDPFTSHTLMDMDHLSRSVLTLHEDPQSTRKENSRKPARTNSAYRYGNLKSMGSEPQLNMYGPPGLQSSILPRLTAPIDHSSGRTTSSTLPRHMRGNRFGYSTHQDKSQQKQQHKTSPQHSKQPPTVSSGSGGGITMTQPSPAGVPSASLTEHAGSREKRSLRQDKSQSSRTHSSSSSESSSPLQKKSPESSNNNSQRLRSSGR